MGKFLGLFGSKDAEKAILCPHLTIEFVLKQKCLYLKLVNHSFVPAYNVQIGFDRPLIGVNGTIDISKLPLFKNLPYIGPSKEFEIFVDLLDSVFLFNKLPKITFKLIFEDQDKKSYSNVIIHDLTIYKDLPINSSASI